MSTPKANGGNVQPWAPRHRGQNTHPQFKTYASAAHGLDAISPPLTAPPWSANLALGERLFIPDSALDPAIKAIAATFICVGIAVLLARISFLFF